MSDGNQSKRLTPLEALFCILALLGLCALLFTTGRTFGVEAGRNQVTAREHYDNAKKDALRSCVEREGPALAQCVTEAIESAQNQSETRQDLYAQQDMAKWAFWMFGAALLTLGVTALGVLYVRRTLAATLEAVEDTGKATKAMERQNDLVASAQRAWVTIKIEPRRVRSLHGGGLNFDFDIVATNIGQTVAHSFELNSDIIFRGQLETHEGFIDRIHAKLDKWRSDYDRPHHASLVPRDIEIDNFEGDQSDKALRWWDGAFFPKPHTQPIVVAAAFYTTVSAPDLIHLSWRTWYLGHRALGGKFQPFIVWDHVPIEAPTFCTVPFHTTLMHEEYPANDRRQDGTD